MIIIEIINCPFQLNHIDWGPFKLLRIFKRSKEPIQVPDYYCAQNNEHNEVKYKLYVDDIVGPKCLLFGKSGGGSDIKKQKWDSARKFCRDFGGDLVSIHSFAQNSFIMSHLHEESYWIGFGKEISSGTGNHGRCQTDSKTYSGQTVDL